MNLFGLMEELETPTGMHVVPCVPVVAGGSMKGAVVTWSEFLSKKEQINDCTDTKKDERRRTAAIENP